MTEKNPATLFTPNYICLIQHARELNEDSRILGEKIYFHPTESNNKIKMKNIDLNSDKPLCEVSSVKTGSQHWEEHWLEAYIISKSKNNKNNKWKFDTSNKTFRFLSSQLKFRGSEALRINGKIHTTTDLLFYDEIDKHIVIWELKSDRKGIPQANEELNKYVNELKRLFLEDEKEASWRAFDLPLVKDIKGYIVCPRSESKSYKSADANQFDLCEFDCPIANTIINEKLIEPWEQHREKGAEMKLYFKIKEAD